MARILTFSAQAAALRARFPGIAASGTVASLDASGQPGTVDSLDAAAVRGFAQPSAPLVYVKALESFFVAGDPVAVGDFVEVEKPLAQRLANIHRAILADPRELADALAKPAPVKGAK